MRIALFVDAGRVTRWQAAALEQVGADGEVLVYNCLNTRTGARRLANAFYYALNLFTIRNRMTRSIPLSEVGVRTSPLFDFECVYEGAWQRLPATLLRKIEADAPDVILKFGLSLLRVPDRRDLAAPILSYHHGDPRKFRGRPAGFYEILRGEQLMGQIVQILSNRLDAGQVVAFAATKVHRHSYRKTLVEAYRHSPLILKTAIANAANGASLDIQPLGRAFRLPDNITVLRFLFGLLKRSLERLCYGAFVEKAWSVSTACAEPRHVLESASLERVAAFGKWRTEKTPAGYTFLADPFFHPGGDGLLVEALNAKTGTGEIFHLGPHGHARLSDPRCHLSYPGSLSWDGADFIVPEISEWSPARIFRLVDGEMRDEGPLNLPGELRILDPTLFVQDRHVYLFGNDAAEGGNVLRLWTASSPFEPFVEHPASPILISPQGGRMAGAILQEGSSLHRLGQNGGGEYGIGLIVFRIDRLTPEDYLESAAAELRFPSVMGPHTLNFRDGQAVFDWYRNRFSLAAGIRRLRGRLARR
jgi:hypothetical protein